jgi:MerR family transcriptional regulator, light-induced transcriptional regulator
MMFSIAAVERDTGLTKDTLRVWERRYGFPTPGRDDQGERVYPFEQVERLRTIKRLLDAGHRPGRIVAMPSDELERLGSTVVAEKASVEWTALDRPALDGYLSAIAANDVDGLKRHLALGLARLGLGRFVLDIVGPLNGQVGEAWMQGRLEVFQEHLYTEAVQSCLRQALQLLQPARAVPPRVLLATVSGEPHGLGLLMAEAMLSIEGCSCASLGVQTPIWDIVRAAEAVRADIVALGYTGCTSASHIADGLAEMRAKLPSHIEIWVGGNSPVVRRKPVAGVKSLASLEFVPSALSDWRAAHRSP